MRKLVIKVSLFTLPFFILYIIQGIFFIKDKGDLIRLGYIYDNSEYDRSELFKNEDNRIKNHKNISEINLKNNHSFDVLTVGDSFSEIGSIGYQNYFVEKSNKKLLHYDRFLHNNPIETVHNLANGDFFNRIKVKYVILQCVERYAIARASTKINNEKLDIDSLAKLIVNKKSKTKLLANLEDEQTKKEDFFSSTLIRFPLYNLLYNVDDNAFFSTIYKVRLNQKMFSNNNKELLFIDEDIIPINSNENINKFNDEINSLSKKLSKKGIQLIFLPSPDKFEIYYNYIQDKTKYPKPVFFNIFNSLPKKYISIEIDKLLKNALNKEKDIYYYDDTHWSPKAAKIVAEELDKVIK
ncbi:MAG: hypothetical protein QM535_05685 [Limnohabitans sp.]|nr:hypothetical protein [Limnohabitans sp.]